MRRLPNGLIQCPQWGQLENLIRGTKSKKGKAGSLATQSNISCKKKTKNRLVRPIRQSYSSPQLSPQKVKPIIEQPCQSNMVRSATLNLMPSRKRQPIVQSVVQDFQESPVTSDSGF